MISIEFGSTPVDKSIKAALQKAAKAVIPEKSIEISIVVCDDDFIQKLNQQYRGVDRPTDVLSFPSDEIDPETNTRYLGDIILSLPRATSQAIEANHSVIDEVSMLAIHGVLHLLGFDHQTKEDKIAMWEKQDHYLQTLGISMDRFSGDD